MMLFHVSRCIRSLALQQPWKNMHCLASVAQSHTSMNLESPHRKMHCVGKNSNIFKLLPAKDASHMTLNFLPTASSVGFRSIHTSDEKRVYEDHETKSLTVWKDLRELPRSPLPALTLGLAGLIPFLSAPLYLIYAQQYIPSIVFAQFAYGVTILSFLGGVRWGASLHAEGSILPDWKNLSYSVMPSLVAWLSLLVPSEHYHLAIGTLMTGLGVTAYFDIFMHGYPGWFKGLRFVLSLFAILSLWTSFVLSFLLKTVEDESKET